MRSSYLFMHFMTLLICFVFLSKANALMNRQEVYTLKTLTPKQIYQRYSKAVVLIIASQKGRKSSSFGTGLIILVDGKKGKEKLILTNAHVIFSEASNTPPNILVYLKPQKIVGSWRKDLRKRHKAVPVSYDRLLDIALLKVEEDLGNTTIKFFDANKVEVGDPVVAIGHPEQGGLWTLTTGTISSQKANINNVKGKDVFQTDANINRGNSGGPLLNKYGGLVGVNTSISRKSADGLAITGINFALKSSTIEKWMKSLGYTIARIKFVEHKEEMQDENEHKYKTEPQANALEKQKKKKKSLLRRKEQEFTVPEKPEMKAKPEAGQNRKHGESTFEKGGEILTERMPFEFNSLIDFLMSEKEKEIDKEMQRMWQSF